MNRFIIMDKAAHMPSSCSYGPYRKVAVVEVEESFVGTPSMISTHARGVVEVHYVWDRCYKGKTNKCAYGKAMAAAQELVDKLNRRNTNGS